MILQIELLREKLKNIVNEQLKIKKIKGLTASYFFILDTIYRNKGKIQLKVLAEITGKRKSTVTDLVKNLERKKYLKKCSSSEDKRIICVELDSRFYENIDKFKEIKIKIDEICFEGLDSKIETMGKVFCSEILNNVCCKYEYKTQEKKNV